MTLQKDGQAKCDKCGKLDGDIKGSNTLQEGWTRGKEREDGFYRHYCPDCSKEVLK